MLDDEFVHLNFTTVERKKQILVNFFVKSIEHSVKMSGNLSVEGELRYIVQWFNEWSELQREDFLPIVVEYLTKDRGAHYMNGVVNSLSAASFEEKPMSLFQCRVSQIEMFSRSLKSFVKLLYWN